MTTKQFIGLGMIVVPVIAMLVRGFWKDARLTWKLLGILAFSLILAIIFTIGAALFNGDL